MANSHLFRQSFLLLIVMVGTSLNREGWCSRAAETQPDPGEYATDRVNPSASDRPTLPDINDLPSYPEQLPLMKMIDGTPLSTLTDWETERKPELIQAMQHYTYGYLPPPYPVRATRLKSRGDAFAGLAAYEDIQLDIPLPSGNTATIYLALFIPHGTGVRKPVIIYLSGQANHMSTTYDQVTVRTYAGHFPATRGTWQANYVANVEYPLTRGYAVAHFCTEDLDPDVDNDIEDGLYRLLGAHVPGSPEHRLRQQISWAWGVHRVVDYLVSREDIDDGRIVVNGFSRRGRAAAVASALDDRIALCWNHAGGATHSWRDGELYDAGYMYWFNDYHLRFVGREALVPFDGNAMIALHAPRPLLDTGGDHPGLPGESYVIYDCHDHASAYGEMLSADVVYRLYPEVQGVVGTATGPSVPRQYRGRLFQVVDTQKGHFQDIEFWKHGIDFMDVQFKGRCVDPYSTHVYEAEEAILSGCTPASTKIHHYGSGYVGGLDAKGDSLEFRSVCPGPGTHYIGIRAACGGLNKPQQISVAVNGQTAATQHELVCWTDQLWFMDYRIKAHFAPGDNTVRITKQNAGQLYVDRLVIYTYDRDAGAPR